MITGSWAVRYADGSALSQYQDHPEAVNGEVPLHLINWSQVTELQFESQWAQSTFTIVQPPEGYGLRLVRRTIQLLSGPTLSLFLLVCYQGTFDPESTDHATYWLPDGTVHQCPHFDCTDVRHYVEGCLLDRPHGLMPHTAAHAVRAEAHLS